MKVAVEEEEGVGAVMGVGVVVDLTGIWLIMRMHLETGNFLVVKPQVKKQILENPMKGEVDMVGHVVLSVVHAVVVLAMERWVMVNDLAGLLIAGVALGVGKLEDCNLLIHAFFILYF